MCSNSSVVEDLGRLPHRGATVVADQPRANLGDRYHAHGGLRPIPGRVQCCRGLDTCTSGTFRRWSLTYEEFAAARLLSLLRYATMLTGDPHLAGDLVQDVMVKVQVRWRRVAAATVPELYVRRMVTNAYLDWRRTGWWRLNVLWARPEDAASGPGSADHANQSADRDQLW